MFMSSAMPPDSMIAAVERALGCPETCKLSHSALCVEIKSTEPACNRAEIVKDANPQSRGVEEEKKPSREMEHTKGAPNYGAAGEASTKCGHF